MAVVHTPEADVPTAEEVISGEGFPGEVIPGSGEMAVSAARAMADIGITIAHPTGAALVGDFQRDYSRLGTTGRIPTMILTRMILITPLPTPMPLPATMLRREW